MPVNLDGEARTAWLNGAADPVELRTLLVTRAADGMASRIVRAEYVNYGVDSWECLEEAATV